MQQRNSFADHRLAVVAVDEDQSVVSPSGMVIAAYERAGDVQTGSFALNSPHAELKPRKQPS